MTVVNGETVPKDNLYPVGAPPPEDQLSVCVNRTLVAPLSGLTRAAGLGGLVIV